MKYGYSWIFFLIGLIILSAEVCYAQETMQHPAPDVDGKVWMASTEQEKRAFLFGASSALVLEYHVREKHSEQPSRFVKGWVEALKDMSWATLANKIDAYYRNNPTKMDKQVFDVIWHEIVMPNWKN
ncbi:hypothetical protein K9F62_00365 [Desulfovibrio sp. JY]|nr:hypothetical protein K9F62_00365 [Desulfovibrio sp. JY]